MGGGYPAPHATKAAKPIVKNPYASKASSRTPNTAAPASIRASPTATIRNPYRKQSCRSAPAGLSVPAATFPSSVSNHNSADALPAEDVKNPYLNAKQKRQDTPEAPTQPSPQARASDRPMLWLAAGYENQPQYARNQSNRDSYKPCGNAHQTETHPSSAVIPASRQPSTMAEAALEPSNQSSKNYVPYLPKDHSIRSPAREPPMAAYSTTKAPLNSKRKYESPERIATNGFMANSKRNNAKSANLSASLKLIRPESWSQPTAAAKKRPLPQDSKVQAGAAMNPSLELPGEAPIPAELQFTSEDVQPVKDEYLQQLIKAAKLSSPLANGWTLFSHQKRAILKALKMRRTILALDMGLGKTLIGCVWSRSFRDTFDCLKTIVICPASMKQEWTRTAVESTEALIEDPKGPPETVGMRICSWAKFPSEVPTCIGHFVVICDEAHSMQSMQAARTKDVLKLIKDDRCVGVLLLTGTPMKNGKPSNLFPLLKAVRHPFGRHQKAYERHFCAGVDRSYGSRGPVWDASGSSNLKQLQRLVSSHLLHLTKEQCIELPPLTRESRTVPVSSRHLIKYGQAVKNLADVHAEVTKKKDMGDALLGATQRLRMVCAEAKIGPTVDIAKRVLEVEGSIVIFTGFVKVAKEVHSQMAELGWSGEVLTGETPTQKRQGMVDRFQEGISPVMVCTFGAGGVGLTLTAACTVILMDRPWTHGDTRQAEDRVRRIGQKKAVKSIWISAFDMDTEVDCMLESKKQTSDAVLGEEQTINGGISAKISIPRLLSLLQRKTEQG